MKRNKAKETSTKKKREKVIKPTINLKHESSLIEIGNNFGLLLITMKWKENKQQSNIYTYNMQANVI